MKGPPKLYVKADSFEDVPHGLYPIFNQEGETVGFTTKGYDLMKESVDPTIRETMEFAWAVAQSYARDLKKKASRIFSGSFFTGRKITDQVMDSD